ncbi:MAG: bifunctional phosphopantothenoylcysteine decarboxylase/phosphopantothenate--cysteine ligase CoaBC [Deltaproteobacteria bacterium]|nr:MAG: bifunctional phosphopantothenoylcysteine decarboxylase/phosphopantothenate--cysteine ligase CoaBC [Deltaproteobacteria bacterium]
MRWLEGKKIVLGVTGGIAAYRACDLVRELTKEGAVVNVVMTKAAQEFITPLTLQTLSQNPVITELFNLISESRIGHISLAQSADLLIVAPATANIIGKFASGIADDMLSTLYLATRAPVLIAPAMNEKMYLHPAVQENMERLRSRGVCFVDPEAGELACGDVGIGRLAEVSKIVEMARMILAPDYLKGKRVVVTAGPTSEPLDPVREVTNRSSGKMGFAFARVAARLGAEVTLVSGPTALPDPPFVGIRRVRRAEEMLQALEEVVPGSDLLVMAAAVADFRPKEVSREKIKKEGFSGVVELERNVDILRSLSSKKGKAFFLGFAAETEKVRENAAKKMREKGLDAIFANDVSRDDIGFSSDHNQGTLIFSTGEEKEFPRLEKEELAFRVLEEISGKM